MFAGWSLLRPVWLGLGWALADLLMLSGASKSFALPVLGDRGLVLGTLCSLQVAVSLWESALGSPQVRFPPPSGVFSMISESQESRDLTPGVLWAWTLGVVVLPSPAAWILTSCQV